MILLEFFQIEPTTGSYALNVVLSLAFRKLKVKV